MRPSAQFNRSRNASAAGKAGDTRASFLSELNYCTRFVVLINKRRNRQENFGAAAGFN